MTTQVMTPLKMTVPHQMTDFSFSVLIRAPYTLLNAHWLVHHGPVHEPGVSCQNDEPPALVRELGVAVSEPWRRQNLQADPDPFAFTTVSAGEVERAGGDGTAKGPDRFRPSLSSVEPLVLQPGIRSGYSVNRTHASTSAGQLSMRKPPAPSKPTPGTPVSLTASAFSGG